MIKVLVIISIIFAGALSFGAVAAAVPAGQMAESFENLSNDILDGLIMYGLLDDDENIVGVSSVIEQASISFELDVITVDPDDIPNTKDEFFINAISQCVFSSNENIDTETCVICTLTDSEQNFLGNGRVDLPEGYVANQNIPINITDLTFEGANDITNVHGVTLEVCSSNEGCTPGYWRSHLESWPSGISPEYKFSEVFGLLESETITINLAQYQILDPTLGQAVNANGGGLDALIRHSVAALLNSQSAINYPLTSEQVVTSFFEAYSSGNYEELKDTLTELNENGCPLANQGIAKPLVNNEQGKSQSNNNNGTGKP